MSAVTERVRRRPLEGLLVLDFSQYVAGPLATMLLSDLGADVIKVERPGGDAYRNYDALTPGQGRYFCSLNRGKSSVVCDLSEASGRVLAEGLIARADAIVHNFLPQRAVAFGLDAASVKRLNPRVVVCTVSAFGSVGPEAGTPGYDLIAQASSGLLALAARPGQQVPERVGGIPLADFTTGLLATVAVLSGLIDRERRGDDDSEATVSDFEVSLLGASLTLQAQQISAGSTVEAQRLDREASHEQATARAAAAKLEPYYRCYETADVFVAVACLDVAQRLRMLGLLGLQDPWVENPQRLPVDSEERATREALVTEVEKRLRGASAAAWLERFSKAGVPAAEVMSTTAAADSEQALANGLVLTLDQPGLGPMRFLGGVLKQGGEPLMTRRPAPRAGEHQRESETLAGVSGAATDEWAALR
jgi:crotonobetainyl-CoA:carnitine CoA-transferase CaiB-like acyl-CoA transferase